MSPIKITFYRKHHGDYYTETVGNKRIAAVLLGLLRQNQAYEITSIWSVYDHAPLDI